MKPTHKLDIYGFDIYLATTPRQWKQLRKQFDWLEDDPLGQGRTVIHYATKTLIFWIKTKDEATLEIVNTCAHEASHAAHFIMEPLGDDYKPGDEPVAYLAAWLTEFLVFHSTKRTANPL